MEEVLTFYDAVDFGYTSPGNHITIHPCTTLQVFPLSVYNSPISAEGKRGDPKTKR